MKTISFFLFQSLFESFTGNGSSNPTSRVSVTWEPKANKNIICSVHPAAQHPSGRSLPVIRDDNEDLLELRGKQTRRFRLPATKDALFVVEVECREQNKPFVAAYDTRIMTWRVQ